LLIEFNTFCWLIGIRKNKPSMKGHIS
jgi:hypothetical protein